MRPKLGILAGGGALPRILIDSCRREGRPVFVVAFSGQADAIAVSGAPHAWMRLGGVGAIFHRLGAEGVEEVVMAGTMTRPPLWSLMPDCTAIGILWRLRGLDGGDDRLLRGLVGEVERVGFRVVGVDQVAPELLAREGAYGRLGPEGAETENLRLAVQAALEIGTADVGQGAVARAGRVIATEDRAGTNAMLDRVATLPGYGGVLVKTLKPGQERRADLPTIGVDTVARAKKARLAGIAVEAGSALVIDANAVVRAADAAGIFVVGIRPAELLGKGTAS